MLFLNLAVFNCIYFAGKDAVDDQITTSQPCVADSSASSPAQDNLSDASAVSAPDLAPDAGTVSGSDPVSGESSSGSAFAQNCKKLSSNLISALSSLDTSKEHPIDSAVLQK